MNKKVSIAIPASVVSDTPHLREKTSKIGLIGRAAAIFCIDEIMIYLDNPRLDQTRDAKLIAALLAYMETPQYLRKRLFKLEPTLQYVGILPPLRTAHHPLKRRMKDLRIGEYREGVTLTKIRESTLVDIGVEQPAILPDKQIPADRRVTLKIMRVDHQVEVGLADSNRMSEYWGYMVTVERQPLGKILKNRNYSLTIATSKLGIPFADVAEKIAGKWSKAESILVAFGAPTQGLHEIVDYEGQKLEDAVDFVVNTFPMQGTQTVRTEEALIASLAIMRMRF